MRLLQRLCRSRTTPAPKTVFYELRIVDSGGKVRCYSTWQDVPDGPTGWPRNITRLHAEATRLCEEPGDRGSLYFFPNLQARSLIKHLGPVMPTGRDTSLAVKKALVELRRDGVGVWWVTDDVIERVRTYLSGSQIWSMSHLEARIIDALDDEPTYPGEGKDQHVAVMVRVIHTELAVIGTKVPVESSDDVLAVERSFPVGAWHRFGVPPCEDCQSGVQHIHWSGDPDPSLRDSV